MALGGAAWRNETRAWRRAMLKTPRPNTVRWMSGVTKLDRIRNKRIRGTLPQRRWEKFPRKCRKVG